MMMSIHKVAMVVVVVVSVAFSSSISSVSGEEDLKVKCSADFQKMMSCLSFAQGSSATPSKECCDSMSSIKDRDPKCLCYIMQQTGTGAGAQQLKTLGVQMAKLLQLPDACQLKNASISHCPAVLGIPPNSPDAAVFNNVTTPATPAAPGGTGSTSAPARSSNVTPTANGPRLSPPIILTAALALFLQLTLAAGKLFPN